MPTIRISPATAERLAALKTHPRETMDDVLSRLLREVRQAQYRDAFQPRKAKNKGPKP